MISSNSLVEYAMAIATISASILMLFVVGLFILSVVLDLKEKREDK